MARYWRFVFAFLFAAAANRAALGQSFTCSVGGPSSIQPGQSATLTFTTTNTGSSPLTSTGSASDTIIIAVDFFLTYNVNAVSPHVHLSNAHSSDPALSQCNTYGDGSTNLLALCSNPSGQPVSIVPGAVETITATVNVDAGSPSGGGVIDGDIQVGANGVCNAASANLSIGNTCTTTLSAPPVAQATQPYTVSWTPTFPPPVYYELDESTTSDFSSNVTTHTPGNPSQTFTQNPTPSAAFYYRVRTHDCNGSPGPYSNTVKVVVQQPPQPVSGPADVAVPFGSTTPVAIPLSITGPASAAFTASVDKPFLSVSPTSGSFSSAGSTVVTATGNPSTLPPGANTGTVTVLSSGATVATVPVSISLVTPVLPGTKSGTLPANTLILPVITHVNGASAVFQSDVRLTNASLSDISYQLLLTPTRSDATQVGVQTTVPVSAGQTIALNDIAKDFFGFGATGAPTDQGFGSLQIIPLNTSTLQTFASSRTYATAGGGTFGQFVPVTLLSTFATQGKVLSLQHVAQSSSFHTNLGLVEGSGASATVRVRIIDDNGTVLQTVPITLQPGEHQQLNNFIVSPGGISELDDGRLEVIVDSATGAVTAYASVLDNITQDPYAVAPVQASTVSATRFIAPGVADLNNGAANFHSDLRIFNGGATSQSVTLTYFPQITVQPVTAPPITIGAGQVKAIDNVLPTLFGVSSSGGSVLITTGSPASLVATVRTYSNSATGGTFGQFIPGVMPSQGAGVGDRGLEVLQLEQSAAFRSNVGVVELTGNSAHVRMTLVLPDSKAAPILEFDIKPNEFKQFNSIIASMNPTEANTYNARMIVEVLSGSGRVTAYGSVLDNRTQDPTYVPAQ